MNRRRTRTKKKAVPAGYDSALEHQLHNKELKGWEYHPTERISYVVPSTYEPDFKGKIGSKTILVEVKGRFRTREEASKYIHIRQSLDQEKEELIFIFQDANKPMPFVKKRKDGTKQTHGEWAQKNGFVFYCLKKGLPKKWTLK